MSETPDFDAAGPAVTLVVTPREKWSVCRQSLDSILAHGEFPHRLVYVDGGSPAEVRDYVAEQAKAHGFEVIRTAHYLTPNQARLLGLARVTTPYVVFIDNDVVVTPGWLERLVDCAESTGAGVVSPVVCQGQPIHEIVHCAGGECGIKEVVSEVGPERHIFEHIAHQGKKLGVLRPRLARRPTGLAEFHCLLARTELARLPGAIDPQILNTREHVDFCMVVANAGGSIWLEPDSVVTYLHDSRLTRSDLPYFMLRWSDGWERKSLEHVVAKWDLCTRGTLGRRIKSVGWRRRQYLVAPFAERLTGKVPITWVRNRSHGVVMRSERLLNRVLTQLHAWRAGAAPR